MEQRRFTLQGEQEIRVKLQEENDQLRSACKILEEQTIEVNGKYIKLKNMIFGKSSEKELKKGPVKKGRRTTPKKRKKYTKKPSEKYPNLPIIDQLVAFADGAQCDCCQANMTESGLGEVVEFLDVTPRKYSIIRQRREKYRCDKCYSTIKTAPSPPRIKAGSSYSDEFILDVALSKYCDLIPIERFAAMAKRQGVDLAPNSLIGVTHHLADFLKDVYELLKKEILTLRVLHADETRHRMLQGDKTPNWYLWGFSNRNSCYFEYHDTRAGSVASNLLHGSSTEVLISDVYSGYLKAIKDVNSVRKKKGKRNLLAAYCNSHSRRKFKEAEVHFEEAVYYLDQYKIIYKIESECKNISARRIRKHRKKLIPIFKSMRKKAESEINKYSSKSDMYTALNYFIKNFDGLTMFTKNPHVAIDNNSQERLLRSPVIGRKTWLGTHSKRGAETAAILFSIVESCKLNSINPRQYFKDIVKDIHQGHKPSTPYQYKLKSKKHTFKQYVEFAETG